MHFVPSAIIASGRASPLYWRYEKLCRYYTYHLPLAVLHHPRSSHDGKYVVRCWWISAGITACTASSTGHLTTDDCPSVLSLENEYCTLHHYGVVLIFLIKQSSLALLYHTHSLLHNTGCTGGLDNLTEICPCVSSR